MPAAVRHDHRRPAPAVEGVCLDVDGTLVDYASSMRAGLRALLGTDDAWADWCAVSERHYPRFTSGQIDFETMRRQRTKEFFAIRGEVLDEGEVVAREQRRMTAVQRAWQLFDDALPCLRSLRARGLALAAVTNAAGEYQRCKLRALGLDAAFDVLVISDEVGVAKPDPGIFHAACTALGVRMARAVHVGDRLDLDAEGARAAGLHGVWLDRTRCGIAGRSPGVPVISQLRELPALVSQLHGGGG
ncbi:MAG: HAD-IA family hydrolase [Pseudonocardiaceae bacterium]|nr:HAD-IA family hydrolase [Pseudonocardiaceae bacterium]